MHARPGLSQHREFVNCSAHLYCSYHRLTRLIAEKLMFGRSHAFIELINRAQRPLFIVQRGMLSYSITIECFFNWFADLLGIVYTHTTTV